MCVCTYMYMHVYGVCGGGEVGVLGRDPVVHALGIDNFHHKFMP